MLLGVEESVASIKVKDWITFEKVIVRFFDDLKIIPKVIFSEEALTLLSRP